MKKFPFYTPRKLSKRNLNRLEWFNSLIETNSNYCIETLAKNQYLYRKVCRKKYGNIVKYYNSLHKCNNRRCINPNHLYYGTIQDNTYDRIAKQLDIDLYELPKC